MTIEVFTRAELERVIGELENDSSVESYEVEFAKVNARGFGAILMMQSPRECLAKIIIKKCDETL